MNFDLDADEAVVGLMAKHIAEGADWPIWFSGQAYMGALEAYLASVLMLCLGPGVLAVKLTALLLSLCYLVTAWALARRVLGPGAASWFTCWYLAVPPLFLTLWSIKLRGGFLSVMALGQAILWLAHVIGNEGGTRRRFFFLGLLSGIALWTNLLVTPYLFSAGLYLLWRRKLFGRPAQLGLAVLGLLLGAAPFWIYNLLYQGATFQQLLGGAQGSAVVNLINLCQRHLPVLLGEFPPWQIDNSSGSAAWLIRSLFGASMVLLLWVYRESLWAFLRRSRQLGSGVELYLLTGLGFVLAAALTHFGNKPEPRYAMVLYTVLAPALGLALGGFWRAGGKARLVSLTLALLVFLFNAVSIYGQDRTLPNQPIHYVSQKKRIPIDRAPLYRLFENEGIEAVVADYWIGQLISFETAERVVSVTRPQRHPAYLERYRRAQRHGWILHGPAHARAAANKVHRLGALGLAVRSARFQDLSVVWSEDEGIAPENWQARASSGPRPAHAFDRLEDSRWTTGCKQLPGQWWEVDLGSLQTIQSLGLLSSPGDAPRHLRIEGSTDGQVFSTLLEATAVGTFWQGHFEAMPIRFLRLTQLGTSDRWWSIKELFLYSRLSTR